MQRQSFSETQEKEKLIRRSNEAINEDIHDDTGADQEEDDDTSDAEKISGSDEEEEEEDEEDAKQPSPKGSPDVRKRRPRKAD